MVVLLFLGLWVTQMDVPFSSSESNTDIDWLSFSSGKLVSIICWIILIDQISSKVDIYVSIATKNRIMTRSLYDTVCLEYDGDIV